jgi:glycosyltransferase involved in cell wall biosynthesis
MSEKLLVFIPCYNCGQQITRVLRQFDDATSGLFSEILVLDNGSKDNTVKAATEASKEVHHAQVTIGRNHANYSLGGSHKVAFR